MAAVIGDYMVRRNSLDTTTTLADEGTPSVLPWDTQVHVNGTSVTYSAPTFTLASGKWLICHQAWWDSTLIVGRTEAQVRLVIGGTDSLIAAGQKFADSGGQEVSNTVGMGILDIASDSTTLTTKHFRTDSLTPDSDERLLRENDEGDGVSLVALDPTWAYGLYSSSQDRAAPTDAGFVLINFDTNDQQDTGFSNSSGAITITDAGKYIVCFSVLIDQSDENTADFLSRITLDDAEVMGTRTSTFMRGGSGCQDACLSYGGIIEVAALDVLKVEAFKDLGTNGGNTLSGSNLQIVKLPSGAKTCIVNANSGDMNPGTRTAFAWDTVPQIDTDTFTHTAGATTIEVDNDGFYLAFSTMAQMGDGANHEYPTGLFLLNGSLTDSHAGNGAMLRGTGGIDSGWSFGGMYDLSAEDTIGVQVHAEGDAATHTTDYAAFTMLRLDDILVPSTATRRVFVT